MVGLGGSQQTLTKKVLGKNIRLRAEKREQEEDGESEERGLKTRGQSFQTGRKKGGQERDASKE